MKLYNLLNKLAQDHGIYRITHIENLSLILSRGQISCTNSEYKDAGYKCIGHRSLIEGRGSRVIKISPFGTLNDYVPFYFSTRTPMLLQIQTGRVHGVDSNPENIIYFVSSTKRIVESDLEFVFSDGHAYQEISKFYNNLKDLKERVDWDIIESTYWKNEILDNDRQRRKQAEFLVFKNFPVSCILGIAVYSGNAKQSVEHILKENDSDIPVKIYKDWYY